MAEKIKKLEKQIAEKNRVLDSLDKKITKDKEEIHRAKNELDRLLYIYYKSIKCKTRECFF